MNTKHTPGPWRAEADNHGLIEIIARGPQRIAMIAGEDELSAGQLEANARLIAAAPDLLALLIEAHEAIDVLADDAEEAGYPARSEEATGLAMRIRAAIAKATGKAI